MKNNTRSVEFSQQNQPQKAKKIKLPKINQDTFQIWDENDIESFDDALVLIENMSYLNREILHIQYDTQKKVNLGFLDSNFYSRRRIASLVKEKTGKCCIKTVDRFHQNMKCIVNRKKRFFGKDQTSNEYHIKEETMSILHVFHQVGLLKTKEDFKRKLRFLKDKWIEADFCISRLMNMLKMRISPKHSNLGSSYKHWKNKMSPPPDQKCRPNSYSSLIPMLENTCTGLVPLSKIHEIERFLMNKVRNAVEDIRWWSQKTRKTPYAPVGMFKKQLMRQLAR